MLQDTAQEKQAMGYSESHLKTSSDNDAGAVLIGDKSTVEESTFMEGEDKIVAENTQGDQSTVSTELSRNKRATTSHPSSLLEAETDPTSIPSGILDDLDLDRKCTESPLLTNEAICGSDPALRQYTESPLNSIEAAYGSDSVHSGQSASSTEYSDPREGVPAAVNPRKVEAIGDHFAESSTKASASRFYDPKTDLEAQHINNKIKQAHDTMEDIERHPEEHFRDHGSSFQVSARPKEYPNSALGTGGDIENKRKVHFAPDPLQQFDIEEGYNIKRPAGCSSSCCTIL